MHSLSFGPGLNGWTFLMSRFCKIFMTAWRSVSLQLALFEERKKIQTEIYATRYSSQLENFLMGHFSLQIFNWLLFYLC
jgi:hypothetical protein